MIYAKYKSQDRLKEFICGPIGEEMEDIGYLVEMDNNLGIEAFGIEEISEAFSNSVESEDDQKQGMETPCAYISIGGVANQQTIDRIKNNLPVPVIIAVDNDEAGDQCRKNNSELQFIIPTKKDWNEDLMKLKNTL